MLREEVWQAWTSLKEKLTTNFHSTLIRPFTAPLPFKTLSNPEITALKERLVEKENFLVRLEEGLTSCYLALTKLGMTKPKRKLKR